MIKLKEILIEGVYDKASLKAVIMSGGPGSGKTTVAKELFGFDKTLQRANLSAFGMKRLDLDNFYVNMVKKKGYSLDVSKMSKELDSMLRGAAITQYDKQKDLWIDSRLGVILDTVSSNLEKVKANKQRLEENGYDVICVFIDVSLETALERNRNRERKLPDDLVKKMWQECEDNKDDLKKIFGNNLFIVPNGNASEVQSRINKFLREPVKNPIGKAWVELQLKLKNRL
jgi:tRNA uridine 5-carbamoylmethylation protein Kti12